MTFDIGWLASGLVFATFCAKRMLPLRALAMRRFLRLVSDELSFSDVKG